MCGLFSINSFSQDLNTNKFITGAKKALNSMSHRGPDGSGLITKKDAILGHRRLSIIDINGGQQPMLSNDGKIGITYNGEIYNYSELKDDLIRLGHQFITNSDTEVVLKAFSEYGINCLEKFNGMFAFVIVNFDKQEIFAARDRFGIKPLYFHKNNDFYIFSSEIRPIFNSKLVKPKIDSEKFEEFLVFGYVAGPETLFRNIKKIEGGHYLYINSLKEQYQRYWHPGKASKLELNFDEAVYQLDKKLFKAVKSWSVSDVEVGALLSGGIDSSLLTAMSKNILGEVNTYSVGFPEDKNIDETPHINNLANFLKVQNTLINFTENYIHDTFTELTNHFDEPISDPNNYTLMALCKNIREMTDIKVVLCGEGADELFGGYPRHRYISQKFADTGDDNLLLMSLNKVAFPRLEVINANINFSLKNRDLIINTLESGDEINRVLEYDQLTFMTTRLHSQDTVGMYFGLEIRTPYLDHNLVEFVNGLPGKFKISNVWSKHILRKVAQKYIPESIAWEKRKIGLNIPYSRMLENGPLKTMFENEALIEGKIKNYFPIKNLQKLLKMHKSGHQDHDHSNTLWRILALEYWLQSFD